MSTSLSFLPFCLALLSWGMALDIPGSPLVRLSTTSKIRGLYEEADNGRIFRKFEGIEFALPPTFSRRFQSPQAIPLRQGVFNATRKRTWCLQRDTYFTGENLSGQEDCLYLNIYTPLVPRKRQARFPVLAFISGPTFSSAPGSIYDPRRLLAHDLVLVTFSHRVGPFGFLSTQDSVAPGNAGLLDQVAVLRWIKKHIGAFGGDAGRVTLAGQGSGAHSVLLHLASPLSKGLFHGAIVQSGSPLCPLARFDEPLSIAHRLGSRLRCPADSFSLVSCLRRQDARRLFETPDSLLPYWQPVVEGEDVPEAFLPEDPVAMLKDGLLPDIPVLVGLTQEFGQSTGSRFYVSQALQFARNEGSDGENRPQTEVVRDAVGFILHSALPPHSDDAMLQLVRAVMEEYNIMRATSEELPTLLAEIFADAALNPCIVQTARLLAARGPTHLYSFAYEGNVSFSRNQNPSPDEPGLLFANELLYLFQMDNLSDKLRGTDALVSHTLTALWARFVIRSNPSPPAPFAGSDWAPVSASRTPYLRLSDTVTAEHDFKPRHMHFWLNQVPEILGQDILNEH